jgi:hypothetical protein
MTLPALALGDLPPLMSPVTPFAMLCQAVARSADAPTLERLIALDERWQRHAMRKAFETALAAARADIPMIIKNRENTKPGRGSYRYEDLAEIARTIGPALASHRLSYRFRTETQGTNVTVACILSHGDGYHEEIALTAPIDDSGGKNNLQAIGSTLTYLQRMTLKAALGLAATDDDDGRRNGSAALIDAEQESELKGRITEAGADEGALLRVFKIDRLADLPAARFQQACDLVRAKGGRR